MCDDTTSSFELCGEKPTRDGLEPCPLDRGHEGDHVFWTQTGGSQNAVWVYAVDGTAEAHFDMRDTVEAGEVGDLYAFLLLTREHRG